jgi:hypothetical protein
MRLAASISDQFQAENYKAVEQLLTSLSELARETSHFQLAYIAHCRVYFVLDSVMIQPHTRKLLSAVLTCVEHLSSYSEFSKQREGRFLLRLIDLIENPECYLARADFTADRFGFLSDFLTPEHSLAIVAHLTEFSQNI